MGRRGGDGDAPLGQTADGGALGPAFMEGPVALDRNVVWRIQGVLKERMGNKYPCKKVAARTINGEVKVYIAFTEEAVKRIPASERGGRKKAKTEEVETKAEKLSLEEALRNKMIQNQMKIDQEIQEIEEQRVFVTQGDANSEPDAEPVIPENVVGKATLSIPKMGWAAIAVKEFFRG